MPGTDVRIVSSQIAFANEWIIHQTEDGFAISHSPSAKKYAVFSPNCLQEPMNSHNNPRSADPGWHERRTTRTELRSSRIFKLTNYCVGAIDG
jgi:hypothetical protein